MVPCGVEVAENFGGDGPRVVVLWLNDHAVDRGALGSNAGESNSNHKGIVRLNMSVFDGLPPKPWRRGMAAEYEISFLSSRNGLTSGLFPARLVAPEILERR